VLKALPAIGVLCCLAVCAARAEETRTVEPYEIDGGWRTYPSGYWIQEGRCLRWAKGPVVEYGCMGYVCRGSGECEARTVSECGLSMAWVGNMGEFGAPLANIVAPSPTLGGPFIGVSMASPGRRR
jgi:hypothetical protein